MQVCDKAVPDYSGDSYGIEEVMATVDSIRAVCKPEVIVSEVPEAEPIGAEWMRGNEPCPRCGFKTCVCSETITRSNVETAAGCDEEIERLRQSEIEIVEAFVERAELLYLASATMSFGDAVDAELAAMRKAAKKE